MYDIDAWIFSVVFGNVPAGATRESYYYPLMIIARVFCTKLFSKKKWPEVWMVVTRVILGATLDEPAKIVKNDTKHFRKDVMKKAHLLF